MSRFYKQYDFEAQPFKLLAIQMKIAKHLKDAKTGNRLAETKLCDYIGSCRASADFNSLPIELQTVILEATQWLRSVGRLINLAQKNPQLWISSRSGHIRI